MGEPNEQQEPDQSDDKSVLDPETQGDGNSTDDTGDGGTEEGDDSGDGGTDDTDAIVQRVMSEIEPKMAELGERIADRTVSAALKQAKKNSASETKEESPPPPPPVADVRGARLAFREYVSDDTKFIDAEERSFAMDLGSALISARSVDGFDDEDKVGRDVAAQVASTVKSLRSMYEKRTKEALKRKGLLVEKREGQPTKGPSSVGMSSEFEKGAELARERFAVREPSGQNA